MVSALMGLLRLVVKHPEVLQQAPVQAASNSLMLIDNQMGPAPVAPEPHRSCIVFEQVSRVSPLKLAYRFSRNACKASSCFRTEKPWLYD